MKQLITSMEVALRQCLDDGTGNANGLGQLVNTPGQLEGDSTVKQREVSDIVYIGKNQA